MDRRGFLGGVAASVAGVVALWPGVRAKTPEGIKTGSYSHGWDDAMSTLQFQIEVAEARGEKRGRDYAHRALRFTGAPPMPEGWSRRVIDLKTGG